MMSNDRTPQIVVTPPATDAPDGSRAALIEALARLLIGQAGVQSQQATEQTQRKAS